MTAKSNTLKRLWAWIASALSSARFQAALVNFIQKESIRLVLKKLVINGGLKGWLITFVVTELVEEIDEHLIEPAFVVIGFHADRLDGATVYKKVDNAKDVKEWVDSLDAV